MINIQQLEVCNDAIFVALESLKPLEIGICLLNTYNSNSKSPCQIRMALMQLKIVCLHSACFSAESKQAFLLNFGISCPSCDKEITDR